MQSRQKSYADNHRRPLEFAAGDLVFLRISPTRGVVRFGRRNKLSPRFIGPFKILQRVGECAYRLALLPALFGVHDIFHVSMLRKYISDPSHVLDYSQLELDDRLTVEEQLVRILDHEERVLRSRSIPFVKVVWSHHLSEDATWERKDWMRELYPHLFGEHLAFNRLSILEFILNSEDGIFL